MIVATGSRGRLNYTMRRFFPEHVLFVEPDEADRYRATAAPTVTVVTLDAGGRGFGYLMASITRYVRAAGERYFLFVDDDITGMRVRGGRPFNRDEFLAGAERLIRDRGWAQLGISFAGHNWYEARDVREDVAVWGMAVVDAEAVEAVGGYAEDLMLFADYEITARLLEHGYHVGVWYDYMFCHKMRGQPGGAAVLYDDVELTRRMAEAVRARYPRAARVFFHRNHGIWEVRLDWRRIRKWEDRPRTYSSPRLSYEVTDCALPMTFDTYNKCAYNCLYCFSYFIKCLGPGGVFSGRDAKRAPLAWVDVKRVRRMFTAPGELQGDDRGFEPFIRERITLQWGGLTDPLDEFERRHGITLELMHLFDEIDYPLSISTKGVWWIDDERYATLFARHPNWHLKVSIITTDAVRAAAVERGVPSPEERLRLIRRAVELNPRGLVTLRFRPFIIGLSNLRNAHIDLVNAAADAGARSVSFEFLCLDPGHGTNTTERYRELSEVLGYDVDDFYRRYSMGGMMRLNPQIKRPYIDAVEAAVRRRGMGFYVSDAHFKDRSDGPACCGLDDGWKVARGQFTNAVLIARHRPDHRVRWSDIAGDAERLLAAMPVAGFLNLYGGITTRVKWRRKSVCQWLRSMWNTPTMRRSPYQMFGGLLRPVSLDEAGDVVYEYRASRVET